MVSGQLYASGLKIMTSKNVLSKTVPQRPLAFMSRRASSVAVEFLSNVPQSRCCSNGSTATSRQTSLIKFANVPYFNVANNCVAFRAVQGMSQNENRSAWAVECGVLWISTISKADTVSKFRFIQFLSLSLQREYIQPGRCSFFRSSFECISLLRAQDTFDVWYSLGEFLLRVY